MVATAIDIVEAQERLVELASLVAAGHEIVVMQAKKPVMRLVPIGNDDQQRVPGLHAGTGWISDDFDSPLPDQFWVNGA